MMHTSRDTGSDDRKISDLISQFMESLDRKDFVKLKEILNPEIHVDYSSFRAERPGIISSGEFVEKGQSALENLDTQHLFSNLEIEIKDDEAVARCNFHIARKQKGGDKEFSSEGSYVFTLIPWDRSWVISGIVQNHSRSMGTLGFMAPHCWTRQSPALSPLAPHEDPDRRVRGCRTDGTVHHPPDRRRRYARVGRGAESWPEPASFQRHPH